MTWSQTTFIRSYGIFVEEISSTFSQKIFWKYHDFDSKKILGILFIYFILLKLYSIPIITSIVLMIWSNEYIKDKTIVNMFTKKQKLKSGTKLNTVLKLLCIDFVELDSSAQNSLENLSVKNKCSFANEISKIFISLTQCTVYYWYTTF